MCAGLDIIADLEEVDVGSAVLLDQVQDVLAAELVVQRGV